MKSFIFILITFLFPVLLFGQAESTVTVSVVNGEQVRCITENRVEVKLTPNPNRTLKLMKLFWDEDSPAIEIKPGESFQRAHTYPINLPNDFCEYNCPINNGICRRVTVVAEYTTGSQENNSMLLTFKMVPEPAFLALVACINNDLVVENRTCPSNDEDMVYKWEYGGSVLTGESDPTLRFNSAGNNIIKLTATNICGSQSTSRIVRVIEPAIPELKADSNVNSENLDSFFICTNGKATIRLVGSESNDASRYNWTGSSGISFIGNTNRDTARIEVSEPGEYVVELEVDNVCNVPKKKQIFIKVFRNQNLTLQSTADTCLNLSYSPNPLLDGVIYEINGKTYQKTDFPVLLASSSSPYIVKATLSNPCTNQEKYDTFFVSAAQNPQISFPSVDTSICQTARAINLESNIAGGRWMVGNKNLGGIFNPSDYAIGVITLDYEIGTGTCASKASRKITIVPGTPLTLPGDAEVCEKDSPITLTASPSGGIWSGTSINAGVFNPAIGSGQYVLTYQYERISDGCISEAATRIKVVEIPKITVPDSIAICNADTPLDINQLAKPILNPSGGTLIWSGSGVSGNFLNTQTAGGIGSVSVFSEYYLLAGCSVFDTIQVTIGPIPETKVGEDTSLCTNQGVFMLEGTPAGGEWIRSNGTSINPTLNLISTPTGKTTYIYITGRGSSCENRDSFTMDLIDSKGLNAGDDLFVCENLMQLDLPAINGVWSGPELIGSKTINLQNLSSGTYVYSLTDNSLPEACNSDDIILTISPLPISDYLSPPIVCTSSNFEIKNNSIGADKFQWKFGDGRLSQQRDPLINYPIAGDYKVILEAIKLNPLNGLAICQTSIEKAIKVINPPEKIEFLASANRLCSPMSTDFINNSRGENLLFTWDFGNGQTSTAEEPVGIIYTASGADTTYRVKLVADNGCGVLQNEILVDVLASPVARFASEFRDSYCSGESIPFGHRSFGNELKWDFSGGNIFIGDNPPPQKFFTTPDKMDTITIKLEVKNQCGLDSAIQQLVIIPTDARAAITVPKSDYCIGDTVFLESLSRPVDGRSIWTLPDGSQLEGLNLSIHVKDTGIQQIKLKALSCGEDSAQISFTGFANPDLRIDAPSLSCPGEMIQIRVNGNGILESTFLNDSILGIGNLFDVQVPETNQAVVRTSARNQAGCITQLQKTIQLLPAPKGILQIPDSICSRETIALSTQSNQSITCSWQLSDDIQIAGCQIAFILENHGFIPGKVTIQNNIGCSDSMLFNLFVRQKPIADFEILIIEDCFPGQTLLTNRSLGENGIEWLLPDGTLKNSNSFLFSPHLVGKQDIGIKATRDQICFDEKYHTIEIFPLPELDIVLNEGCILEEGYSIEIFSFPGSIIELQGAVSGKGNFFTGLPKGEYWINVESKEGCIKDSLIKIPEVREFQGSIAGADSIKILMGEMLNLIAIVNETDVETRWIPQSDGKFNAVVRPLRSGYIIFEAINSRGCVIRDSVYIEVEIDRETGIFIPQAFTPNDDGINDIFMVRSSNPGLEKIVSFKIFGPAGDLVFSMDDGLPNSENFGWNGAFTQSGVYVYLVELEFVDGIRIAKKGDLTLIR
jgi:PKD repeat protein